MLVFKKIFIVTVLFLLQSQIIYAQKENFKRGNKVNISADLYTVKDATLSVLIPGDKYTLLYQYNHTKKGSDNSDSIKKLEKTIKKLVSKYKINEMRVVCYSFDKGADYKTWLQKINSSQPFSPIKGVVYEYYNTNEFSGVSKTLKKIFSKCSFIAPEGKVLATAGSVSLFEKEADNLPGINSKKLKAKLLTDSLGSRIPLVKTVVCFVNELISDTLSQTKTDEYGNFEIIMPEKFNTNYELSVKQNEKYKPESVILASRNGMEIATFSKTNGGFKYRLLEVDVNKLEEIETNDITLSFNNFKKSTNTKLKVIEQINYASGKYDLNSESQLVLDKVANIMEENPSVKLEVISHTDANGDDKQNMELSIKRSTSVINYLISKGVKENRLTGIGKGESMIRNRCANNIECDDNEHAYNRRTEFNFTK